VFERTFRTPEGEVGVLAEVTVEGTMLLPRDVAFYPLAPGRLAIGAARVLRIRRAIAAEAAALGFTTLRLIATRESGAAPGKRVDVTFDLARYAP